MGRTPMTKEQKLEKILNDFELFCLNFVKIIDNDGNIVPFKFNEQQRYFVDNASRFNIILKPRQLGFTTLSLAYALWVAVTMPYSTSLIVSYVGTSAKDLFNKLKRMNEHLPRQKYKGVFPDVIRDNRDELVFSNGSKIISTTTNQKDGNEIARGMTLTFILLSECAFYDDLQGVLNALEPALMKNQKARIVLETTANGHNFFWQLYTKAKKGNSKYKAFFFPFFSSAFEKQFKYDIDQAVDWYKSQNKGLPLSKKDLDKEERQLHEMGCTLRMLMWRQWILQDKPKHMFYQEYPATDTQAFISTSRTVFSQSKILEHMNAALPALTHDECASILPASLTQYIGRGLNIFHLPKPKKRYYAGIDVASGGGVDASAISIVDEEGEQVATFSRNDVPVYEFTEIIKDLGLFFNYALLVIERNGLGTAVLERLRKETEEPYLNIFKHRIFEKGRNKLQLGWTQSSVTKSMAITDLKEAFEKGLIRIHCKDTLQQMQLYGERGENRMEGHHFDLVQALMLAVQGLKSGKYYVEVDG
ncbi:MAG: hypothetical protein BLM47_01955 [Candidatus Reconcilbacillus cellulovorans]|uniref:Terminase large subunit gp17-like C-terminal domain-containing protein n=1 Tax=Candidatus Reconcilbacillus cellulovorans TaxID=1906605 RepID=A0A2A6E2M5_9BACL|nr:MAG: hypothetical protein BLM47_01955 [Candidatus Reconcilbacillus cellulovorans]